MWALGVIATLAAVAALGRYFTGRDKVPPMERHERALDALRNLSEQPRPAAPDAPLTADAATDHVRILAEAPGDTRPARRAPTRRSTARPAWVTDLPTIPIRPGGARPEPGPPPAAGPAAISRSSVRTNDSDGGTRHRFAASRSRLSAGAAVAAALVLVALVVAFGITGRGAKGARTSRSPTGDVLPSSTLARSTTSTPSPTVPSNLVPVVTRSTDGATVTLRSPFVLTLRTTAPCWIDITDTSGTSLFTATLPAGQQQQIPGGGPIVMKLGNMSGVTISAGGVDLDLSGLPQTAN
ncbi:MAG: hypothetical protein QOJ71_1110, partial [Actinomycetota bacterium]|nr:hypothetical protein [Actinomycetota bacterium]